MFKPLIASVTALSIAFASPVQANNIDRDDVGKLLFGLAAIAVVGAAIENRNKRDERHRTEQQNTHVHDRNQGGWSNLPSGNNDWSSLPRHTDQRTLPHDCIRNIDTRFGTQRMFGRRCLQRNYRHFSSLPERCTVRVYTNDGPRRGYDPFCLREQGYRSDRRW